MLAVKLVFGFGFGFVTVLSLLPHALSEPRVDAGRCPEVIVSFSETSGQDHMVFIVIVFIFRALLIHLRTKFSHHQLLYISPLSLRWIPHSERHSKLIEFN